MTATKMTLERLQAIIDAYGTSAIRWPADERQAAEALLAESAAARTLLAQAVDLDELLDVAPALIPTPQLRAAILAAAPRSAMPSRFGRLGDAWRMVWSEFAISPVIGPILAASLVLGFVAGGYLAGAPAVEGVPDLLQLALYDDGYAEF
jgi:hypothetical protein